MKANGDLESASSFIYPLVRQGGIQVQQIVPKHVHSDATCTGYIPATDVTRMHPICELQESLNEWFPMQIIHFNKVNVDTLDVNDEVHIRIRHSECSGGLVGEPLKPGWVACTKCWHASILVLQQVGTCLGLRLSMCWQHTTWVTLPKLKSVEMHSRIRNFAKLGILSRLSDFWSLP